MARLDLRKVKHVSRFDLADKLGDKPITIGRASDNVVVLADTHVSRHHCIIDAIEGKTSIRDLQSHGGTFVNGNRVETASLRHGDRISVGPFDLLFKDPAAAQHSNGELPVLLAEQDCHAADNSRSSTGISLVSDRSGTGEVAIQVRLAELDAREAGLREREASLQSLKSELDQKRTAVLKQDAETIAALRKELDRAHADAVIAQDRIIALTEQAQAHAAEAEQAKTACSAAFESRDAALAQRDQSEITLRELRSQVSQLQSQLGEQAARTDELHAALQARQHQIDQLQRQLCEQGQEHGAWREQAQREIDRLKSHEATLQEQVETLDSSRRIIAERAEQSTRALATLRGQVRSLDEAVQRVGAIQHRLSEIESAFVELDQRLENAQEHDDDELERAALERQRISEELEALNEVRDAAVAQLGEHAEHLRVMTDHQVLQISSARPMHHAAQTRSTSVETRRGRWWKFGR